MACKDRDSNKFNMASWLSVPVLRYLKAPVEFLNELYVRYPDGGEYGWFAFVTSKRTFAYWDNESRSWKLMGLSGSGGASGGSIDSVYLEGDELHIEKTDGSIVKIPILKNVSHTYVTAVDPAESVAVKNGDRWLYTGSPLKIYERIFDVWVDLTNWSSSTPPPTPSEPTEVNFGADGIYDGGDVHTHVMWQVDANYYPFLKDNDYLIIECN